MGGWGWAQRSQAHIAHYTKRSALNNAMARTPHKWVASPPLCGLGGAPTGATGAGADSDVTPMLDGAGEGAGPLGVIEKLLTTLMGSGMRMKSGSANVRT